MLALFYSLREWVAKKAERERERERRRKERRERMLAVPHHKFEDPTYDQQKSKVHEGLEDALTAGKNILWALFAFYSTMVSVINFVYQFHVSNFIICNRS